MYAELSKARLSALVVVTAGAGYASGCGAFDPLVFAALCGGTSLAAGSANTWNQIIERNRDKLMKRTCDRPLPSGRMAAPEAVGWGVFSAGTSCAILAAGTNPVTAGLGAANIVLYAVPYTLSKPRTELNTWVGALVGAVPPVMGWCAAGGSVLEPVPLLLGATLFLWQFPHFFALAWVHRKDYARGAHQMVPVNDPTGERTAALIWNYSLYALPLPVLAAALDVTSYMYAVEGVAATSYLAYLAHKFKEERSQDNARNVFKVNPNVCQSDAQLLPLRLFAFCTISPHTRSLTVCCCACLSVKCSLWYLPLLLALFVYHRKRGSDENASLEKARHFIRKLCLHDALATPGGGQVLCPNVDAVTIAGDKCKSDSKVSSP